MNSFRRLMLVLLIIFPAMSFFLMPAYSLQENSWTSKAPLPREAEGFGVAVVHEKIYVIGGWTLNEVYDPASNLWTTIVPMPTPRVHFGIAVFNNKIHIMGGQNDEYMLTTPMMNYQFEVVTGITEVYDPATNTWETKTSMPTPRNHLQANVVGGKIYLIGGEHQEKIDYAYTEHSSNLTEVYDIQTDTWTTMTPIPNAVYNYASAVVNDKIYIISGKYANFSMSNLVQIFNPETNSWSFGKPIPTPMDQAAAAATSGVMAPKRIYVIGGTKNQVYNPETDSWSSGADMPTERYDFGLAVVNDLLYAIGGASVSLTNANEQYTPVGYGTVSPPPSESPNPSPSVPEVPAVAVLVVLGCVTCSVVAIKKLRRRL